MDFFDKLKSLKTKNANYKGKDHLACNHPPKPSKGNGSCRNLHHYQERYVQGDNYDANQKRPLHIKGKRKLSIFTENEFIETE